MRTFVLGAGGTGGYFGGLLAKSGADVTFVARGEHGRAIRERGLFVQSAHGDFHVASVKVLDQVGKIEHPDLILIFVKSYSTKEIAQELARVITPNTTIVTFQTGLDNDLEIGKVVPTQKIFPGLIYINSKVKEPGRIHQISGLCTLIFGARGGQDSSVLPAIEELIQNAGIKATLSASIEKEMWQKLTWISAFAGLTVLFRSAVGNIVDSSEGEKIFKRFLIESLEVAKSKGIEFPDVVRKEMFDKIEYYKSEGKNAKTSLLLDIEAGNRTEIETMHGTMVRYAREANLNTPLLDTVYAIVKVYEASRIAA